jgi:hypothetical protein
VLRKTCATIAVALLAITPGVWAAPVEDAELYAAGHVHELENDGYFLPGTTLCYQDTCSTPQPLEVQRGANVLFSNFDEEPHQVVSFKKRKGKPLFRSRAIGAGEQDLIVTANLKPGVYEFFCFFHTGMRGALRVVG